MSACCRKVPAVTGAELVYSYPTPSELRAAGGPSELVLATSGGVTEDGPAVHPRFFSGLLTEPAVAAAGMLAVAAVARTSYFTSASVVRLLRDPVVTSHADRLRFESFSGCCGDLPAPLTALASRRSRSRRAAGAALLAEAAASASRAQDHPAAVTQSLAALVSRAEAALTPDGAR